MKKLLLVVLAAISIKTLNAQYSEEGEPAGFKKENVFLGGSLSLGFGSGSFAVGGNPEIGYSVAQWLDAGIIFNLYYASQTYYNYDGSSDGRYTSFNYGGGVFARVYPLPFLFLQVQPEQNWISYTEKDFGTDYTYKNTVTATSFIGAIGYGQRFIGQSSYFFMIGLDLLTNAYSPYLDGYGHPIPIIRGGFDIYLRPSKKSRPVGPVL